MSGLCGAGSLRWNLDLVSEFLRWELFTKVLIANFNLLNIKLCHLVANRRNYSLYEDNSRSKRGVWVNLFHMERLIFRTNSINLAKSLKVPSHNHPGFSLVHCKIQTFEFHLRSLTRCKKLQIRMKLIH